jgi:MFS family permease
MQLAADQTRGIVIALGTAQTVAWGSTYYIPAILANSIAKDTNVSPVVVFTAFSLAMIISAFCGPWSGRFIDQRGGRELLLASNALFIAGLTMLAMAEGVVMLFAAWIVIGIGMGIGLYEAAFATLAALYEKSARASITGITLIAGFASTVSWPLTALVEAHYGWRAACFGWAIIHILIALPLNFLLPSGRAEQDESQHQVATAETTNDAEKAIPQPPRYLVPLLSFVFAIGWFNSTAMAAHLPRLLEAAGATTAVAVAAGALIGPTQVLARLLDYSFMQKYHPLVTARVATLAHPIGAMLLMIIGGPAAYLFTVFHGAGNGIMTIAKGTLPLVLIGPKNYGYLQGIISAPGRVLQAFAPIIFGYTLEVIGHHAIWLTSGLGLLAFLALMVLNTKTVESHSQ